MRIIGGAYKGRHLIGHPIDVRPTTDFAKESLFNILNNYFFFDKISVLDLFSGSGSISFEFASRGCNDIELVEINPKNIKIINDNIKNIGIKSIKTYIADAYNFLNRCNKKYDIIFADPPYDSKFTNKLPEIVFHKGILKNEGWLILEHSKYLNFKNFKHFKEERKYGEVHFSFFVYRKESE